MAWTSNHIIKMQARRVRETSRVIVIAGFIHLLGIGAVQADDPFKKAPLHTNKVEQEKSLAFDQVNWKRPQGVFTWITMARGYQIPWDSHGRAGWMTDDAYVEPVDPGISTFSSNTPEIYIVFEGQPLDAPGQFAASWYPLAEGKVSNKEPMGKDVLELEMNQRFGYFIITPTNEKWKVGTYLVKVYYGSPGQELHETNVVGTMEFTITDEAAALTKP